MGSTTAELNREPLYHIPAAVEFIQSINGSSPWYGIFQKMSCVASSGLLEKNGNMPIVDHRLCDSEELQQASESVGEQSTPSCEMDALS